MTCNAAPFCVQKQGNFPVHVPFISDDNTLSVIDQQSTMTVIRNIHFPIKTKLKMMSFEWEKN